MTALAPILPKLRKLIPLLSSDSEGERLGAVNAINRTLMAAGLSTHDLAAAIDCGPPSTATRSDPPEDAYSVPAWSRLPRDSKLAWLSVAADEAGCGSWVDEFSRGVARLLMAGLPLSPKQNARAQQVIAEAWAKGARP